MAKVFGGRFDVPAEFFAPCNKPYDLAQARELVTQLFCVRSAHDADILSRAGSDISADGLSKAMPHAATNDTIL